MHELSLCRAIAETAIDHAGGRTIERIQLRIGHFRQVVPETLQFCWRMRSETTDLAGCELAGLRVPKRVRLGLGFSQQLVRPFRSMTVAELSRVPAWSTQCRHVDGPAAGRGATASKPVGRRARHPPPSTSG